MTERVLFITATDTGVGKTVVTALLAALLRGRGCDAGVMKPVATGGIPVGGIPQSPDVLFLTEKLGLSDPPRLVNPICMRKPLAPAVAARHEGRALEQGLLDEAFNLLRQRHRILLVEGIGGLLVPLAGKFTVADLALRWDAPLLVVARPGLGTINHTALTLRHARASGLRVAGFVFNARSGDEEASGWRDNAACVEELTGETFWGLIPFGGSLRAPREWESLTAEAESRVGARLELFFKSSL